MIVVACLNFPRNMDWPLKVLCFGSLWVTGGTWKRWLWHVRDVWTTTDRYLRIDKGSQKLCWHLIWQVRAGGFTFYDYIKEPCGHCYFWGENDNYVFHILGEYGVRSVNQGVGRYEHNICLLWQASIIHEISLTKKFGDLNIFWVCLDMCLKLPNLINSLFFYASERFLNIWKAEIKLVYLDWCVFWWLVWSNYDKDIDLKTLLQWNVYGCMQIVGLFMPKY